MHLTKIRSYINHSFIKNIILPSCINCINFIEHKPIYSYESFQDNKKKGRCKLFGKKDIVTGEIEYDYARYCRNNATRCGTWGYLFRQK
jgi:hypothetical protein